MNRCGPERPIRLLHGDAVADEFAGVIHISAGDTIDSSFPQHSTRIRPHFTSYGGNVMADRRFRSRRRDSFDAIQELDDVILRPLTSRPPPY
ncbi:hypothetical protein ACTXT7_014641 [Hymenolepis weldensis]